MCRHWVRRPRDAAVLPCLLLHEALSLGTILAVFSSSGAGVMLGEPTPSGKPMRWNARAKCRTRAGACQRCKGVSIPAAVSVKEVHPRCARQAGSRHQSQRIVASRILSVSAPYPTHIRRNKAISARVRVSYCPRQAHNHTAQGGVAPPALSIAGLRGLTQTESKTCHPAHCLMLSGNPAFL